MKGETFLEISAYQKTRSTGNFLYTGLAVCFLAEEKQRYFIKSKPVVNQASEGLESSGDSLTGALALLQKPAEIACVGQELLQHPQRIHSGLFAF